MVGRHTKGLYQRHVIFLTFLEDNGPELRGRIHVFDVCESYMRIQARTELRGALPESSSAVQVGTRGTYPVLFKSNRTWKLATFKSRHDDVVRGDIASSIALELE